MNFYKKYFKAGKEMALPYYLKWVLRSLLPRPLLGWSRRRLLRGWESRPDADYIRERVDYYCRVGEEDKGDYDTSPRELLARVEPQNVKLSEISTRRFHSRYAIDAQRILRYFPGDIRINFYAGDIWENPEVPTLMRGRRIGRVGGERGNNAVVLNLDSARHFLNPHDDIPFLEKEDKLIFRGWTYNKPERVRFMEQWYGHPGFDLADTDKGHPTPWYSEPITIPDHFKYRYVLCLEGNDVASALQWVMGSNCVPVMPRPTSEGWLMHGRLEPGVHYIEIAPDFSDVEEVMSYYHAHPEEGARISAASKEWVKQFRDSRREKIIGLLVAQKLIES